MHSSVRLVSEDNFCYLKFIVFWDPSKRRKMSCNKDPRSQTSLHTVEQIDQGSEIGKSTCCREVNKRNAGLSRVGFGFDFKPLQVTQYSSETKPVKDSRFNTNNVSEHTPWGLGVWFSSCHGRRLNKNKRK